MKKPTETSSSPPAIERRKRSDLGAWAAVLGSCALLLAAYLWVAVRRQMQVVDEGVCWSRESGICLALHTYHAKYGHFPPAYIADKDGKPMHSWRMLVLEFIGGPEAEAVYRAYRFDEPWDGPNNRMLADRMPAAYACPSARGGGASSHTLANYVLITGKNTLFQGARSGSMKELGNSGGTILVAETVSGVPWMKPQDLEVENMSFRINDKSRPGISSSHLPDAFVTLVGGTYRMEKTLSPEAVKAMIVVWSEPK